MKLTWKNNKKRSLSAVSNFNNLPFEHEQEDEVRRRGEPEALSNQDAEIGAHISEQSKDLNSSNHSDLLQATRLAKEFQSQGDKLAEVLPAYLSLV